MSSVHKRAKQRKIPEFITKLADMIEVNAFTSLEVP